MSNLDYKWWNDIKPTKKVQIEGGKMIAAVPITRKKADSLQGSMIEIARGSNTEAIIQVPVLGVANTTGLQGWYCLITGGISQS